MLKPIIVLCFTLGAAATASLRAAEPRPVHLIPHFHPASCGWLTDWSTERNYCANSYINHLDRVRDDAAYRFAISECNNMIAILNFAPERFRELARRVHEGRVEAVNAFFLEPTINLSGGEALVKCGIEGIRWQQALLGVKPHLAWMIDVTGVHEQMAQIAAGLDLDGFVYCRHNPTGHAIHWAEAPDGTRSLAISPGAYAEWRPVFTSKEALSEKQLAELRAELRFRADPTPLSLEERVALAKPGGIEACRAPAGAPVLLLGGSGDYSLAPLNPRFPSAFLQEFGAFAPEFAVKFSTPGRFLEEVLPGIKSGAITLPVMRGGTKFNYNAFWIQNPRVKSWFRQCEHGLRAAEMLAAAASLRGQFEYPAQALQRAWLLMCLNMDRNTLWGAAGGMVFEHDTSWDVRDRFEWVEKTSRNIAVQALRSLLGQGNVAVRFNPLNWQRNDIPELGSGTTAPLPETVSSRQIPLPGVIQTRFYSVRINPATGAVISLKLRLSDQELLGGPANVIVAEQPRKKIVNTADLMVDRPERERVADSNSTASRITVQSSPANTIVTAESSFIGSGRLRRTMTFYQDNPRIDFETEMNDIPDRMVIVAEFPLGLPVREVRRGIPYGFAHGGWETGNTALTGFIKGITPVIRWSHYQMDGAGVALLDQGLTGREITDRTPIIFLLNTNNAYRSHPTPWLSGAGRHVLRYSLMPHSGDFITARVQQAAWEFNQPPIVVDGCEARPLLSLVQTSDNLIVEALRREGDELELRMVECLGLAGTASVTVDLPHLDAAQTDLMGGKRQILRGGPKYSFSVRPQQIVTLRFRTASAAPSVQPLTQWDDLVPERKRDALHRYQANVMGHPPAN